MHSFNAPPIKVVVGSKEEAFYIHASALESSSEFFRSALKKEWAKKDDESIDLRDQDVEIFKIYVNWLYTSQVSVESDPAETVKPTGAKYTQLAHSYALGEHLCDTDFQDSVINSIIGYSRIKNTANNSSYPGPQTINVIYNNTVTNSPARRLVVDFYVRFGTDGWTTDSITMHHEFLGDLSKALLKDRVLLHKHEKNFTALVEGIACKYHHHDKGKPCQGKPT